MSSQRSSQWREFTRFAAQRAGARRTLAGLGLAAAAALAAAGNARAVPQEQAAAPAGEAAAAALPEGEEIARQISARDDGQAFFGQIDFELTDPRGGKRVREVRTVRRDVEGQRQTVFVFDAPGDLRGTGLLIHDHSAPAQDDDQWLYLPAARSVRRIASSDRGGSFVGTDFSYDDMKNGSKVAPADYRWKTLRREALDGVDCYVVEATPRDAATADALGYGRVLLWVDPQLWMARRAEIWDPAGQPLKTVKTTAIQQDQGIWTAHEITVENQQSGHSTHFALKHAEYGFPVSDAMFTERTLVRGLQTEK